MLMPLRGAAAGALLTAAALLTAPVAAVATPVGSAVRTGEVVGGPDLAAPGVVVRPGPGSTPLPVVDADTWLVADLTTGQVLAAKGAHTRVLPASTLKTLTAITLMPRLDKNQVVTATWAEARADGGHVGIVPGATYTIWDLWHGLLLPSANDAAAALADANGGMAATVADMQATARELQAGDTTVKNNSGLDAKGQLSSAYDMALFARAALALPDFRRVTRTVSYPFPGRPAAAGAQRSTYQIYTQNRLLLHGYPGTIGGKTGFTSLAHRTFWGAATRGGHTIVVTLFQIHEPTESAARALLTWGFANTGRVTPVGTLVEPLAEPSATPSGAATATVGGGATSASAAGPGSNGRAPWAPLVLVALLVALVGGGLLRRRRRRQPAPSAATTDPPLASSRPAVVPSGPARTAATRTPSVAVSAPGRPRTEPAPAVHPDREPTPDVAPVTVASTAPTPPPAAGSDELETEVTATAAPVPFVEAPAENTPAPRPVVGGHVRVITPPGRAPRP